MNHIIQYSPRYREHQKAFVDLLIQQGRDHGREITPERADAVSTMIGREFEVTFIAGPVDRESRVKGMTVTKEADFAEGRFLYLEDIVVGEEFRGQKLGLQLIYQNLLDAWNGGLNDWEQGLSGYSWETGRDNKSAAGLYRKIDSSFDAGKHPDVWRFSAKQSAELLQSPGPKADLTTVDDMNLVATVIKEKVGRDYDRLLSILQRQRTNGINEDSFVVSTRGGGLAFASEAYSTFQVNVRADVRVYPHPRFRPEHMRALIKGVSAELARRRRWQGFGSINVELVGSASSLNAASIFEGIGGEALTHAGSPMVAHSISGKAYVQAVLAADRALRTAKPLTASARARLAEAAKQHGLVITGPTGGRVISSPTTPVSMLSTSGARRVSEHRWQS